MGKKKIKDLTLEDCKKICKKYPCTLCPIQKLICGVSYSIITLDIEEEIEVEEDKPQKCKDLRGCC